MSYQSPAQKAKAFFDAMSPVEFDMYVTGMSREAVEAAHRARAALAAQQPKKADDEA